MRLGFVILPSLKSRIGDLLFERRYGLDTSDHVDRVALGYETGERIQYEPSGWNGLVAALARREVSPQDVFLDVGSGKGRVVFQAALRYPFKRVIGVELSEKLSRVAQENIDRNRSRLRCPEVQLVNEDILRWELPSDLTVVYMHNPFVGSLFEATLERLNAFVAARDRPLRLIYVNPTQHEWLVSVPTVRELPLPSGPMSRLLRGTPGMIRRYELGAGG